MTFDPLTSIQNGAETLRKGSKLLGYLGASLGQKKVNNINALERSKSRTIPPVKGSRDDRLEALADWVGWCGENMCKVYYFKRALTKTQCLAFGLAYPAFTEGYYKKTNALPFNQFHPDDRVAARYIDETAEGQSPTKNET